jgi:hypothetical protein
VTVGVPCDRCDPWTPEKIYEIRGDDAAHVLRRVLAYQQIDGASDLTLREAGTAIRQAGSATELLRNLSDTRGSLWRLGPTRRLALEIAINDSVERQSLQGELRYLERVWQEQEEIAAIADEELTSLPGAGSAVSMSARSSGQR